jgi:hypothetical protein
MRAVTTAEGAISISSPIISPSASPSIVATCWNPSLPEIHVPLLMQDEPACPPSITIDSPLFSQTHPTLHADSECPAYFVVIRRVK